MFPSLGSLLPGDNILCQISLDSNLEGGTFVNTHKRFRESFSSPTHESRILVAVPRSLPKLLDLTLFPVCLQSSFQGPLLQAGGRAPAAGGSSLSPVFVSMPVPLTACLGTLSCVLLEDGLLPAVTQLKPHQPSSCVTFCSNSPVSVFLQPCPSMACRLPASHLGPHGSAATKIALFQHCNREEDVLF